MKGYYVYIMTNYTNKVLYTGYTNNLQRRIFEHKFKLIDGFTKRFNLTKLVYFERFNNSGEATIREKQIKGWIRVKKIKLINSINPEWKDLANEYQLLNKSLFFELSR